MMYLLLFIWSIVSIYLSYILVEPDSFWTFIAFLVVLGIIGPVGWGILATAIQLLFGDNDN